MKEDPEETADESAPDATESEDTAAAETAKPTAAFELIDGARIEYGTRSGKVTSVRGNGEKPYDVQIRWDGAKYPEWYLFAALRKASEEGEFRVVEQGRVSFLQKLLP